MRLILQFFIIFLTLLSSLVYAEPEKKADYFKNKDACFILFDITNNKLTEIINSNRCERRVSPDSTFKLPLSLMAFNEHVISQDSIFPWDGRDKGMSKWNKNQTPQSWLKNSTVWVSQLITPLLGENKIKTYLKDFSYGNQNFEGNPKKQDGLKYAWLESSLKISPLEQLRFLKKLLTHKLPISTEAEQNTVENLYLEESTNGWKLYGKTGSGHRKKENNEYSPLQNGWFIGFIEKENQKYIFVLNFSDTKYVTDEPAGVRAKNIVKKILKDKNLF